MINKVRNIYYMLAYAFQVLNEDSYAKVALENFEHIEDLLAAILAKGIANQIKRGLGREYITKTDTLSSPRGKISISKSLQGKNLLKKQLICDFDEFSENAYINKILKTTAFVLIRSNNVEQERKKTLKKVMLYFDTVDILNPFNIKWTGIKYCNNNLTYKMLINICFLVFESLLLTEKKGFKKLPKYLDNNISRLFEKFVLAYYQKHYPEYNASAAFINWNIDDGISNLLPMMKTDITLEYNEKTLIIDTKYYTQIMQTNNLFNSSKFHSGNLYQIYTYVKNKDINCSGNVSGLLLYAKTDEEISPDHHYNISGNKINVKTLDLDNNFEDIKQQLNKIVNEWQS